MSLASDFVEWATDIGLNEETINAMKEQTLECLKALWVVPVKELKLLKLKLGQNSILVVAVNQLQ